MSSTKVSVRFVALAGIAVLAFATAAVVPARADVCGPLVDAETFKVSVTSAQSVYRVGDTATVKVRVERSVGEQRQPAEGVVVGVGVRVEKAFLYGGGVTDSQGLASVKIKLKADTPTGFADVEVYAYKTYGEDLPCQLGPRERGWAEAEDLFLVRPSQ